MTVILELNAEAQRTLETAFGQDLSRAALEAMAIEGYRAGKLTRFEVQQLLGFGDRWVTESWLKEHGAHPPITMEDVLQDLESSVKAREAACSSSPTRRL